MILSINPNPDGTFEVTEQVIVHDHDDLQGADGTVAALGVIKGELQTRTVDAVEGERLIRQMKAEQA